jgi:hypothetical protein
MRKVVPKLQLRPSLGAKLEIGRPVSHFDLIKLTCRVQPNTTLTPILAEAASQGSFAPSYAQGDPKVAAPGKPWSKN